MKPKRKYVIYEKQIFDYGDGNVQETREPIGETWAVSEAQAINNYCYRKKIRRWYHADWDYDGCRDLYIEAELA